MGITGLIPFLEKASSKCNVKDLKGCTVAIDTYCWLHKGAIAAADKLARGETTDVHIKFCLKYVNLLLSHNVKPILVFDGQHLPAKKLTESRRREVRKIAKQRAAEFLRVGKIEEARSHMRRCIDITHEMALQLIKECRKINVDCIVAPYEADAQIAYLNKINIAQYVITEDSDLTLFGCTKIIFKFDIAGNGLLVDSTKYHLAMGCRPEKFTLDKFRYMCILSGCDYLDSLPGIGLAKACKFFSMTQETDIKRALLKIPAYLNMGHLTVDDDYIEAFLKADATFKHMYVYNPIQRQMVRLNELSEYGTNIEYCSNAGKYLDAEIAFQLALGNLHPFSLKQIDNWNPDVHFSQLKTQKKINSIWMRDFLKCKENSNQKAYDIRCAFKFKKVNIEPHETSTETKCENENDILSFYTSPQKIKPIKRSRSQSNSNDNFINDTLEFKVQKTSPNAHNPFLKIEKLDLTLSSSSSSSDLVSSQDCSNNSLLKSVSPGKRKLQENENLENTKTIPKVRKIVKSRLFAANRINVKLNENIKTKNVEQQQQQEENESINDEQYLSTSNTEENNEESHVQKVSKLLYLTSPEIAKKKIERKMKLADKVKQEKNKKEHFEINNESENHCQIKSNENDLLEIICNGNLETLTESSNEDLMKSNNVEIIDVDDDYTSVSKSVKNLKKDKIQSRLSMFGFKKRATLKTQSK